MQGPIIALQSHFELQEELNSFGNSLKQVMAVVDCLTAPGPRVSTRRGRRRPTQPKRSWTPDPGTFQELQNALKILNAQFESFNQKMALESRKIDHSREGRAGIGRPRGSALASNETQRLPISPVSSPSSGSGAEGSRDAASPSTNQAEEAPDETRSRRLISAAQATGGGPTAVQATSRTGSRSGNSSSAPAGSDTSAEAPNPPKSITLSIPSKPETDQFLESPSQEEALGAITQLAAQSSFDGRVSISRHTDLAALANIPLDDHVYFRNLARPSDTKGTCHVTIDVRKADVQWPDTSKSVPRPSKDDMLDLFEQFASKPPPHTSYYGGCASTITDDLLSPLGKSLPERTEHANVPYFHIGDRSSGTAFHREDANFWSCNIVEFGWKIWVLIRDTAKFERFIKANWRVNDCWNFVRHLSLIIAPSKLKEEGIGFDIYCTGPGEMMVTRPGTYHEVLNYSPCIARSVNFLLPGEPAIPDGLKVCKDCGLYAWKDKEGVEAVPCRPTDSSAVKSVSTPKSTHKRKADTPLEGPVRKTRAHLELDNALDEIRKAGIAWTPAYDVQKPPTPHLLKLAAGIRSKMTEAHLAWISGCLRRPQSESTSFSEGEDRLSLCSRVLKYASDESEFCQLRLRVAQLELMREIDKLIPAPLKNVTPEIKEKLTNSHKWDKRQLKAHMEKGRGWVRLCGEYTTLLCFLPEKGNELGLLRKQYRELTVADILHLHELLSDEHAEHYFQLAEALQEQLFCLPGKPRSA